jgi:hypothetical protein
MSDIEVKSYRYLRMTIVVLLLGLGVAVLYQTGRQEFHPLESISAYYYTPAQAIFVGSLIGMGACMIALKGTTETEDVFLNLGGMAAAVVALVPTTRGKDFESAVRLCKESAAGPLMSASPGGFDCPTVDALQKATRANVLNNVTTLLVLGGLALVVAVAFVLADRRRGVGIVANKLLVGFVLSVLLWVFSLFVLWMRFDWVLHYGHFIGAISLFGCVFIVTMSNALRRHGGPSPGGTFWTRVLAALRNAREAMFHWPLDRYPMVAWAMILGIAVMGALFLTGTVTLFWLEIVVALGFIAFWLVQTTELLGESAQPAAVDSPVLPTPVVPRAR